MGYDITFHPVALAEPQHFVFDVVDNPRLLKQRTDELPADPGTRRAMGELFRLTLATIERDATAGDEAQEDSRDGSATRFASDERSASQSAYGESRTLHWSRSRAWGIREEDAMKSRAILCVGTFWGAAVAAQAATITVTAPGAGMNWVQNSVRVITWTSTGLPADQTVSIVLRLNGARLGDIALDVPAAQGQYQWTVGTYLGGQAATGTGYQVRVRTADLHADSAPFAISPPLSLPHGSHTVLVPAGTPDNTLSILENAKRVPESEVLRMLPDLVVCTSNSTRVHPDGKLVAKVRNRGGVQSPASTLHFDIQGSSFPVAISVPALNAHQVFTATRSLGAKWLFSSTTHQYTLTLEIAPGAPMQSTLENPLHIPDAYPQNNSKSGTFYVTTDPIAPTPGFVCADGTTIP
jgi:hypothetical protein